MEINLVYFSATYTTKKIIKMIAGYMGDIANEYDITQSAPDDDIPFSEDSLLIVGMPVYAGRIPAKTIEALNRFKGNGTPAILVCVYGNRDYDDALLELKDTVEPNGFRVISAGVFIAQHSIFPKVGEARPDAKDIDVIKDFADKSADILSSATVKSMPDISVKGNRPYKIPGKIPLKPKGNKHCDDCGTCVKLCPVFAIDENNPRKTNKKICISCGRCIVVCPQKARSFGGLLYKIAGSGFVKANSARKEPEFFLHNPSLEKHY